MRSMLRAAAGLVLVLFTSACFFETEATLGDPDPKTADARLVGTWYSAEKDEVVLFSIAADEKEPGVYRAVYASVRAGNDEPVETANYRLWRTVLNGRAYLNARRIGGGAKDMPAQTIIAYDIADNALTLRLVDMKRVVDAIQGGKLKGSVSKGSFVDRATVTAPRAELAAFIAGADKDGALFPNKSGALLRMPERAK